MGEDEVSQKEARLHFILNDFEDLILEYGADYIMSQIRFPIYTKIHRYFESM